MNYTRKLQFKIIHNTILIIHATYTLIKHIQARHPTGCGLKKSQAIIVATSFAYFEEHHAKTRSIIIL